MYKSFPVHFFEDSVAATKPRMALISFIANQQPPCYSSFCPDSINVALLEKQRGYVAATRFLNRFQRAGHALLTPSVRTSHVAPWCDALLIHKRLAVSWTLAIFGGLGILPEKTAGRRPTETFQELHQRVRSDGWRNATKELKGTERNKKTCQSSELLYVRKSVVEKHL